MATKFNAKTNAKTETQSGTRPKSNAQRQADYRARHLKSQDNQLQRLNLMVDLHAKIALQRLASCYGVTQKSMLESLILQAQQVAIDEAIVAAPNGHADYYDERIRLQRPGVTR
jgi:hypothetical protein